MQQTITIEWDGDTFKALAPPKSLWPVFVSAMISGIILVLLLLQMYLICADDLRRHDYFLFLILLVIWLALVIPMMLTVYGAYQRRKMLSGIIMETGMIKLYTPELSQSMKEVNRNDVIGAYLRSSVKNQTLAGMSHCANLHLSLKNKRDLLAMVNQPAHELKRVMDIINSTIKVEQHKGFEVVLHSTPPSLPLAVQAIPDNDADQPQ